MRLILDLGVITGEQYVARCWWIYRHIVFLYKEIKKLTKIPDCKVFGRKWQGHRMGYLVHSQERRIKYQYHWVSKLQAAEIVDGVKEINLN